MWIKICANTSLDDAMISVDAGADALGFVFAPSKRRVVTAQVAAITAKLPPQIETVGVFTTDDVEEIVTAVTQAGLHTIQLHGGVRLDLARELAARLPGVDIILTLSYDVNGGADQDAETNSQLDKVDAETENYRLLVDSKLDGQSGGTGVPFDWTKASHTLKRNANLRLIVAGGLTVGNVASAIHLLEPWGVDVASGVEHAPGIKDPAEVREFIRNARAAAR